MPMPKTREVLNGRRDFLKQLHKASDDPPLSAALVDVDGFHAVNQNHGRKVGDELLRVVERELKRLPTGSIVTRIGGDEFACAFPNSGPEEALLALEEVRRRLDGKKHRIGSRTLPVRISAGIASFPQHVEDPAELLDAADEALHKAKNDGRNRIAIFVEDKMVLKSNYYSRAQLGRLQALAKGLRKTEAAILREALARHLEEHSHAL